jgi:hypothetical protein
MKCFLHHDEGFYFFRPIGSQICYVQSKCDGDRIHIAVDFIKATGYRILLLIDPVSHDNSFSKSV